VAEERPLTVEEASAAYESAMRNVLPPGPGVCEVCGTWIAEPWRRCYPCSTTPQQLDVVVPITYSEHLGQVHHALRYYKDGIASVRTYAATRLLAILWRFVLAHEPCVAEACGVPAFDVVTTVPSSTPERDEVRTLLRTIVEACDPLADRFERVLRPTGQVPSGRDYDERRYVATRDLTGLAVLLIDDTWTTGGHAQSAAFALKQAGASTVGLVVIGRHVRPSWQVTEDKTSGDLFNGLPRQFDWTTCRLD